jgi:hypothetical protein
VTEFGEKSIAVSPNDWLSISPSVLSSRISQHELSKSEMRIISSRMHVLRDANRAYGRAAIFPTDYYEYAALVAGGIRVDSVAHILGVLVGEVVNAARDAGKIEIPESVLSAWASEQARLILNETTDVEFKAKCAEIVLRLNGSIFDLPLARWGSWLSASELRDGFASVEEVKLHVGRITYEDEYDFVPKHEFEHSFKMSDEILLIPQVPSGLLGGWKSQMRDRVVHELADAWGDYFEEKEDTVVGIVGSENISRVVSVFRRTGAKD